MRKFLLLLCLAGFTQTISAQSLYKPFKVDFGWGIANGLSNGTGVLTYMEPSFTFHDRIKAGFRIEGTMAVMKSVGSAVATGDYYYYVARTGFRAFAGAGIGSYSVAAKGGCGGGLLTTSTSRTTRPLGAMLRTGFEWRHLHISLEYNFLHNTDVVDLDDHGNALDKMVYKNSYLGAKIGFSIGGGIKKIRK